MGRQIYGIRGMVYPVWRLTERKLEPSRIPSLPVWGAFVGIDLRIRNAEPNVGVRGCRHELEAGAFKVISTGVEGVYASPSSASLRERSRSWSSIATGSDAMRWRLIIVLLLLLYSSARHAQREREREKEREGRLLSFSFSC